MNTFSNRTCLNVKYHCFIFQHIVQIHLNIYPIYKQVSECLLQIPTLAAVQTADKQLIAPRYLMRIPAIFFIGPNNGNHWGSSPDYIAGVVTLLTPVGPLSIVRREEY